MRRGQATALAVVTRQLPVRCPRCDGGRFHIPDNGIGVVCQMCGAWSLVTPVERFESVYPKEAENG